MVKLVQNLFLFCIAVLKFQSSNAQICTTLENNIDYFGGDVTYTIASTVAVCCSNCAALPGCTSFTFVVAGSICWMKNVTAFNVRRLATNGRKLTFFKLFRFNIINKIIAYNINKNKKVFRRF